MVCILTLPVVHINAVYINKAVVVTFLKISIIDKTKAFWNAGSLWNRNCWGRLSKMKFPVLLLDMEVISCRNM
jgi:hypothetical protein